MYFFNNWNLILRRLINYLNERDRKNKWDWNKNNIVKNRFLNLKNKQINLGQFFGNLKFKKRSCKIEKYVWYSVRINREDHQDWCVEILIGNRKKFQEP